MDLDIRALASARPYIARVLGECGVPARDVDDLAQVVTIEAWRMAKAGHYEPRHQHAALHRWLHGIAWRWASNHKRSARFRREFPCDAAEFDARPDERPGADELIETEQRRVLLLSLLGDVDATRRPFLVAHAIEGVPMVDVAPAMRTRLDTCWSRYRRGLDELRAAADRHVAREAFSLCRQPMP